MKVGLQNLYKHEGNEIKEKMRKGERVVVDFDNTVALGAIKQRDKGVEKHEEPTGSNADESME